ncbi:hypothetical protein Micbo1qcDRAFT_176263 [Microdochium bolleyi]|uniref:Uncharacterized protein n=1 Tax=Microdochium bolleyi TaxID=196109 RepID=A0A136IZT6_9PEZI|nr:hypothetical protein Micbo1qcDRAFT_176263 [Microdochium bolleyi]
MGARLGGPLAAGFPCCSLLDRGPAFEGGWPEQRPGATQQPSAALVPGGRARGGGFSPVDSPKLPPGASAAAAAAFVRGRRQRDLSLSLPARPPLVDARLPLEYGQELPCRVQKDDVRNAMVARLF